MTCPHTCTHTRFPPPHTHPLVTCWPFRASRQRTKSLTLLQQYCSIAFTCREGCTGPVPTLCTGPCTGCTGPCTGCTGPGPTVCTINTNPLSVSQSENQFPSNMLRSFSELISPVLRVMCLPQVHASACAPNCGN
jgi:hypothetical protein